MAESQQDVVRVLVRQGKLSQAAAAEYVNKVEEMLAQHQEVDLLKLLRRDNIVTSAQIHAAFAELRNWQYIDLSCLTPDPEIAALIPSLDARRLNAAPIRLNGNKLVVAVSNPDDLDVLEALRGVVVGHSISLVYAQSASIKKFLNIAGSAMSEATAVSQKFLEATASDRAQMGVNGGDLGLLMDEDPTGVVGVVSLLIEQAASDRVSDIHIEPTEHELCIRYRIDGVLNPVTSYPKAMAASIASRIKVMASLDIAERRIPQDGRMSVVVQGASIDLRVSVLPTVWGEALTLRVLTNTIARKSLTQLGFSEHNLNIFDAAIRRPHGMVIACGPTGSGKSTTLYAGLQVIASPAVKVITIEDPVEYRISGINQIQVNPAANMTFDRALRSILRADPDIILVGEMRDRETAQVAIEAAITGHLVLSTLHTNDAPSAITRLLEMGVEPFLVASAIESVLAQRLCRRLCYNCKEEYAPDPDQLEEMGFELLDTSTPLYRARGCEQCTHTGYLDRVALHEVMPFTEEVGRLAIERAPASELMALAIKQGMQTLRDDGWRKIQDGLTSVEEVLRVIA